MSLKWKIARYLYIFAGLLLFILILFQLFLLEPMYEKYKLETMSNIISKAIQAMDEEGFADTIYNISSMDDVSIRIYDGKKDIMAGNYGSPLYKMKLDELNSLVRKTSENKGEYIQKTVLKHSDGHNEETKSMMLSRIVNRNEQPVLVVVYSRLSPMNVTLKTLRIQLLYIAIMLIIAVLLLTYVMNKHIAIPLIRINKEAKEISEGEYDIDESTNEYLEAQELNATLLQASNDIVQAEKAKRDLISNISHDLRTPLTMIQGYGEMMLDLPNEMNEENMHVIIDEATRLSYLVNDLLDLSKLKENQIHLEYETFDLSKMIEGQMKKYAVYEVNEGFTIVSEIQEGLCVYADCNRIEQVFNNFMTNAINYCGEVRKVIVRVFLKNEVVRVEVEDFGIGIPKDKQELIWDRYYKLDKTHVRPLNSSGIGLSIAKEILDMHHATYGVESQIDQGSVFFFELPVGTVANVK